MSSVSEEEIERLANRLAMLVSDDGEADNAGRAVGALARRLGLTGGQLKAIFMAGAESAAASAARLRQIEREVAGLRAALAEAEQATLAVQRERDALVREATDLQTALSVRRTSRTLRRLATVAVVLMLASAGALIAYGPKLHFGTPPLPPAGAPDYHEAAVHDRPAVLRRDPDAAAPALATLPVGTQLAVHRVFWRNLMQWVEVGYQGQTGFVLSTEVDLS